MESFLEKNLESLLEKYFEIFIEVYFENLWQKDVKNFEKIYGKSLNAYLENLF